MAVPGVVAGVQLGKYEPLLELASGGMGTVFIARHLAAAGFERLVVIKRVHPHLLKNRDFCDMFRDEAKVCASIRSPHVVPVIDVVEEGGELFLVLEYVESLPLSVLVTATTQAGECLAPDIVSRIFADTLAGLHAAHEAVDLRGNRIELIHRDVSPQNIIVGADGASRLIDFGIAKAASRMAVTSSGVVKGKLPYMSPEQVQRKTLDRRADIFAAGAVLFEALTGRRAFPGDNEGDVALGVLLGDVPGPSTLVPGLPPEVDAVVAKALERDRDDRFHTAAEFQEALERALPPAAPRDVARIVTARAGTLFDERRAILESTIAHGSSPGGNANGPKVADQTAVMAVAVPPRRRGAMARSWWFLAAAVIVTILASATIVIRRASRTSSISGAPAAPFSGALPADVAATTTSLAVPATSSAAAATPFPSSRPSPRRVSPRPSLRRSNPYGAP